MERVSGLPLCARRCRQGLSRLAEPLPAPPGVAVDSAGSARSAAIERALRRPPLHARTAGEVCLEHPALLLDAAYDLDIDVLRGRLVCCCVHRLAEVTVQDVDPLDERFEQVPFAPLLQRERR